MATQLFGYTLFSEGYSPTELIEQAILAEAGGFDFLVISDHFHPWLPNQKHSGFAWSMLGAIAQATSKIQLATMVTCPTYRYHPAIIAQAAATIGILSGNRFILRLGSGERLNEHITGVSWPSIDIRQKKLQEAIEIIRLLWSGGFQSYDGRYLRIDDARVFDLPDKPLKLFVAAGGVRAAKIAAESQGGVCITEPDKNIIDSYVAAGGNQLDTWGQAILSWDSNEAADADTAYQQFRFSAGGWKVQSELSNPVNFDAATKNVRPKDLSETISCGPDVTTHLKLINKFVEAGVNQVALTYPGTNHEGFMEFWKNELKPALT
jgi:G6PDH family F420-dependent oxidoreductase